VKSSFNGSIVSVFLHDFHWYLYLDSNLDYRNQFQDLNIFQGKYSNLGVTPRSNWKKILDKSPKLFKKYVPDGLHPGPEGCLAVITPEIIITWNKCRTTEFIRQKITARFFAGDSCVRFKL